MSAQTSAAQTAAVQTNAAQPNAANAIAPFPDFTMVEGKKGLGHFPITGATLCLLGEKPPCFQMPSKAGASVDYEFGLNPHSERLTLPGGGSWIFFTASYYGGGEGITRLAMLQFADGKIKNLLPYIAVTDIGDSATWTVPQISPYPILITADFPRDISTQLGPLDPRHFTVTAWKFDAAKDAFTQIFSYLTTQEYRGGKRVSVNGVIVPEREQIMLHLMPLMSQR